jgi:hypothetical protein
MYAGRSPASVAFLTLTLQLSSFQQEESIFDLPCWLGGRAAVQLASIIELASADIVKRVNAPTEFVSKYRYVQAISS